MSISVFIDADIIIWYLYNNLDGFGKNPFYSMALEKVFFLSKSIQEKPNFS